MYYILCTIPVMKNIKLKQKNIKDIFLSENRDICMGFHDRTAKDFFCVLVLHVTKN